MRLPVIYNKYITSIQKDLTITNPLLQINVPVIIDCKCIIIMLSERTELYNYSYTFNLIGIMDFSRC